MKEKTCRICGAKFERRNMGHVVCSVECAIKDSRNKQDKALVAQKKKDQRASNQKLRIRKEKLKGKREYTKEAQAAFNRYIRARDYGKPCISCQVPFSETWRASKFDCGHYRSVGAAAHLRYSPLNAWGQCVRCNRDLSGNTVEFRKGLIDRIGEEMVVSLENDNHVVSFNIEKLKRIKALYNRRALRMEKARRDTQQ